MSFASPSSNFILTYSTIFEAICHGLRSVQIGSAVRRPVEQIHANLQHLDRFTSHNLRRSDSKLTVWLSIEIYRLWHLGTAVYLTAGSVAGGSSVLVPHDNRPPRVPDLLALDHARLRRQSPSS